MWIYYYAMMGPGHQSTRSDFEYFPGCYDDHEIIESLQRRYRDHSNVIIEFWEVEKPSKVHVEGEKRRVNDKIKSLENYRNRLHETTCFVSLDVDGEDATIQRNLRGRIEGDVIKRLHRAGLMYEIVDLRRWNRGRKRPVGRQREKILQILRRAKKYSD